MKISARRSLRNALLVLPLAVLLTGACGGGEEESSGASDSGSTGGASADEAATESDLEEWQLAYSSCMRDEGIDMPAPEGDGSITAPSLETLESAAFQTADETCREEFGDPPMMEDPRSPEERHEENLRIAECFRDNGVDVVDPAPGEMLSIDMDIPEDVFEACDVQGLPTGAGS